MERPTEVIQLPDSGANVTIYTYITGGQSRDLQKALLKGVNININEASKDPKNLDLGEIPALIALEQEDMALNFLVKSIALQDGTIVTDIPKFVYDLTENDDKILRDRINTLTSASKLSEEVKKK